MDEGWEIFGFIMLGALVMVGCLLIIEFFGGPILIGGRGCL